jgi:hypothetical protein
MEEDKMSSRIRNSLNGGVAALIVGAAAIALTPTPAAAFSLGSFGGGGFGQMGGFGHMGSSGHMGNHGLGNAGHGMRTEKSETHESVSHNDRIDKTRTEKTTSRKGATDKEATRKEAIHKEAIHKEASDKTTTDKTTGDKITADRTTSDKTSSDKTSSDKTGSDATNGYREGFLMMGDPDPGWFVPSPTSLLGNGLTATISTEARRMTNSSVIGGPNIDSGPIVPMQASGILTSAWSVNASYEHYWTPEWHQSLLGGYSGLSYNESANARIAEIGGFAISSQVSSNAADPGQVVPSILSGPILLPSNIFLGPILPALDVLSVPNVSSPGILSVPLVPLAPDAAGVM